MEEARAHNAERGSSSKSALTARHRTAEGRDPASSRARQPQPGAWEYAISFKAYARLSHWRLSVCLLARMPADRVDPDPICFRTIADSCCNINLWAGALAALSSMESKCGAVLGDEVSAKSVMRAWRAGSGWAKAQLLLDAFHVTSLRQDIRACNTAIDAAGAASQWSRAAMLLHCLVERHLEASEVSYNSLCRVAGEAHWKVALEYAGKSSRDCLRRDVVGVNSLLESFTWNRSLHELITARMRGTPLDTVSYNSAASAASAAVHAKSATSAWASALQTLSRIKVSALVPDAFTLNFSIRARTCALSRSSESSESWSSALELLAEVRDAQLRLGTMIYLAGFRACRLGARVKHGPCTLTKSVGNGLRMSESSRVPGPSHPGPSRLRSWSVGARAALGMAP